MLKPCFGAEGHGVTRFSKRDTTYAASVLRELLRMSDVLLQAYVPAVEQGEYSAVFIGNEYSHCVKKTPRKGDFRSNYSFGAREELIELQPELRTEVTQIYKKCAIESLYARFDFVLAKTGIILMELELIEPYLFMDVQPAAAQKFVRAFERLTS